MLNLNFSVEICAEPKSVLGAYWRLENWPLIAPHVAGIEMHYEDDQVQVLTMVVNTRERIDRFKSVRVLAGNTIRYFQPAPPPMLDHHEGSWLVTPSHLGARVTSTHSLSVNATRAKAILARMGMSTEDQNVEAAVAGIIRNNSLQTMNALKSLLESRKGDLEPCVAP